MRRSVKAWIPASVAIVAISVAEVGPFLLQTGRQAWPSPVVIVDTGLAGETIGPRAPGPVTAPGVAYTTPAVRAGVMPRLSPPGPPQDARGMSDIEALRGNATYLYVRPIVDQEAEMTFDGVAVAAGHTTVLDWHLVSGSADGPPGQDALPGATAGWAKPIVQQWNRPDRIGPNGPQPYAVEISFTVVTTYPDGTTREYSYSGSISVTVGFAASSS